MLNILFNMTESVRNNPRYQISFFITLIKVVIVVKSPSSNILYKMTMIFYCYRTAEQSLWTLKMFSYGITLAFNWNLHVFMSVGQAGQGFCMDAQENAVANHRQADACKIGR